MYQSAYSQDKSVEVAQTAYFCHALSSAYNFKIFLNVIFIHAFSIKIYAHLLMNTLSNRDKKIEKNWRLFLIKSVYEWNRRMKWMQRRGK